MAELPDRHHLVRNNVNDTIVLFGSSNNVVVNNTANGGVFGIALSTSGTSSNNNEIHANTTDHNSLSGVLVEDGSTGNNITGNKSFGNSFFDMEDNNPNCDSNKWEGNHFNTANQSCIH